jgi:hypothetical protein
LSEQQLQEEKSSWQRGEERLERVEQSGIRTATNLIIFQFSFARKRFAAIDPRMDLSAVPRVCSVGLKRIYAPRDVVKMFFRHFLRGQVLLFVFKIVLSHKRKSMSFRS